MKRVCDTKFVLAELMRLSTQLIKNALVSLMTHKNTWMNRNNCKGTPKEKREYTQILVLLNGLRVGIDKRKYQQIDVWEKG